MEISGSSSDSPDGKVDPKQQAMEEKEEAERRHHHHHHHHHHHPQEIEASFIEKASVEIDVKNLNSKDAATVEIAAIASQKAEEFMSMDAEGQRKLLSDLFTGLHQQPQNKGLVEGIFEQARNR